METHWLFGKEEVQDTAVSKEHHADSLLRHERTITIDFLENVQL